MVHLRSVFVAVSLIAVFVSCSFSIPITSSARSAPLNGAILSAPFTPFTDDGSAVDVSVVPALAAHHRKYGINCVWICGGFGEYDRLSVDERKSLFDAWASVAHDNGLYSIMHVSDNDVRVASSLARYVNTLHGADGIALLPPHSFATAPSMQALVDWLAQVAAEAPNRPLYYYHIPGASGINIRMSDFIPLAVKTIPTFAGVKFVTSDQGDFFEMQRVYGSTLSLLFAPEPKLTGIALGATGFVMAESFYGPTFWRMNQAVARGDWAAARVEQEWKMQAGSITGDIPHCKGVLRLLGVPISLAVRPPLTRISDQDLANLKISLDKIGFFNQTLPHSN